MDEYDATPNRKVYFFMFLTPMTGPPQDLKENMFGFNVARDIDETSMSLRDYRATSVVSEIYDPPALEDADATGAGPSVRTRSKSKGKSVKKETETPTPVLRPSTRRSRSRISVSRDIEEDVGTQRSSLLSCLIMAEPRRQAWL